MRISKKNIKLFETTGTIEFLWGKLKTAQLNLANQFSAHLDKIEKSMLEFLSTPANLIFPCQPLHRNTQHRQLR